MAWSEEGWSRLSRALHTPAYGADGPSVDCEAADPLARDVYGIMGIPIDKISLQGALERLRHAADVGDAFLLSTPNLNFMVLSQSDPEFRESLLNSDLCAADGMPIVWLGRLLGVPLRERIAGSDIFEAIKLDKTAPKAMRLFLFGGADGMGKFVADKINATSTSMTCVDAISPGFGTVEQLSAAEHIERINASNADFVAAFLGAKKGQDWLMRNHARLSVPIRAHLGATINYQAGKVRRAPEPWQKVGLEWLWRIMEEPYLWRRYFVDGIALLRILLTSVLPLAAYNALRNCIDSKVPQIDFSHHDEPGQVTLGIHGAATVVTVDKSVSRFRELIGRDKNVFIDLSNVTSIDARMFGLLIVLRKMLKDKGLRFGLVCTKRVPRWIIGRHGFDYLLSDAGSPK